jgi:hypothetical protein
MMRRPDPRFSRLPRPDRYSDDRIPAWFIVAWVISAGVALAFAVGIGALIWAAVDYLGRH